jgi:hypothetical protein
LKAKDTYSNQNDYISKSIAKYDANNRIIESAEYDNQKKMVEKMITKELSKNFFKEDFFRIGRDTNTRYRRTDDTGKLLEFYNLNNKGDTLFAERNYYDNGKIKKSETISGNSISIMEYNTIFDASGNIIQVRNFKDGKLKDLEKIEIVYY